MKPEDPIVQAILFALCCFAIFGGFVLCSIEGFRALGLVMLGAGLVATLAMAEQDGPF